jgi:hypothetical protein
MSDRVLSCIVDPTDLSGSVDSITISGPSIRFLIDNARMMLASWSCEANCFANNPQPDLQEGLGELNIKSESLRYVVCATSDLLADASMNVEAWILDKVSRGMRATINAAILLGDGAGKPLICGRRNSICAFAGDCPRPLFVAGPAYAPVRDTSPVAAWVLVSDESANFCFASNNVECRRSSVVWSSRNDDTGNRFLIRRIAHKYSFPNAGLSPRCHADRVRKLEKNLSHRLAQGRDDVNRPLLSGFL